METVTDPLQTGKIAVDDLYEFRDHYFETHSLDDAIKKVDDVTSELDKTLALLDLIPESFKVKAEYLTLRGRALNVQAHYDHTAEECLAKAVKLDPRLTDAWICLGECYWKNGDVESARNCFVGALNHCKHKVALRNLSMVLRQLGADTEERRRFVEESVDKAKEAVQMDIKDGTSWFVLGNAYLKQFFCGHQSSPQILKQCMTAYQQAEKDVVASCNPDLHFNRGTVYQYQEEYELALIGYARAQALDPTFPEVPQKRQNLEKYITRVEDLIRTKGKMRPKKLKALVDGLVPVTALGPYGGGSYTARGVTVPLRSAGFDELQPELNLKTVVCGCVVCTVVNEESVPFTFCMVDKACTCFSVTVYNAAPSWGVKIGDTVAIPEPYLQAVRVQHGDINVTYNNIRVTYPIVMVVNGRKLQSDKVAPTELGMCSRSE